MIAQSWLFVSVIIPVFNDLERLKLCLNALTHQTYPSHHYEIVVIDNGLTPSPDIAGLPHQYSGVVVAHEPKRGSYAARNRGLAIAKGPAIAFTDSDCIPASDWLEKGMGYLVQNPDCGLVGGAIHFFFKNPDSPTSAELYDSLHLLQQRSYIEIHHFSATANTFTFKEMFNRVGLFNSDLLSGGDAEWGLRVHRAGYSQIYADDVIIAHPARHSFQELRTKVVRITAGAYDFNEMSKLPPKIFFAQTLPELKPHIKYFFELRSNPQVGGVRQALGCYLTYIALRYVKVITKVRLYLSRKLD